MRRYSTSDGLYRGLLYNLVKSGRKSVINTTSSERNSLYPERCVENIIDYDNTNLFTSAWNNDYGQWVQVELLDRFIDLKAYAMGINESNTYPRHWDIMVSMDGDKWNTPHQIRNSDDANYGNIFKFSKHIGFIRFFKIINRGMNKGNIPELYIDNVDLYGNVVECDTNCSILPHISFTNSNCKTHRISFQLLISLSFLVS
jgi:hypothetical protein